ncbi:unnamed protein product [Caenorhabditis auriculariae]|uniref:Uncharacterized protein n=1 Tax=Caenorhabditis auriculariae TaxID=2777116 RepID=A0A8S1H1I1_9PELO|nr:unnamed protein product [Caenorhabditis auriculariae]
MLRDWHSVHGRQTARAAGASARRRSFRLRLTVKPQLARPAVLYRSWRPSDVGVRIPNSRNASYGRRTTMSTVSQSISECQTPTATSTDVSFRQEFYMRNVWEGISVSFQFGRTSAEPTTATIEYTDKTIFTVTTAPSGATTIATNGHSVPSLLPKEESGDQERSILISLGLDYNTSIDLRESPETSVSPENGLMNPKCEVDSDQGYGSPLAQNTVGGETSLAALIAQVNSPTCGKNSMASQCPECGKHVRKSRELMLVYKSIRSVGSQQEPSEHLIFHPDFPLIYNQQTSLGKDKLGNSEGRAAQLKVTVGRRIFRFSLTPRLRGVFFSEAVSHAISRPLPLLSTHIASTEDVLTRYNSKPSVLPSVVVVCTSKLGRQDKSGGAERF